MEKIKVLIDLAPPVADAIDRMATETGRTRKSMVQVLVAEKLRDLNYKPQLDLGQELGKKGTYTT